MNNLINTDNLIPIVYPNKIIKNRYYFDKYNNIIDTHRNITLLPIDIYNNSQAVNLAIKDMNRINSARFIIFKLYYINALYDKDKLYSMNDNNFKLIFVKPIDGDYTNFNKDNFSVKISPMLANKSEDLKIKYPISLPNIATGRYGFNKDYDVVDIKNKNIARKVIRDKNIISYVFISNKPDKYYTVSRAKLLALVFLMSEKEKLLDDKYIRVKYKDGDKSNVELDNIDYYITSNGKEILKLMK